MLDLKTRPSTSNSSGSLNAATAAPPPANGNGVHPPAAPNAEPEFLEDLLAVAAPPKAAPAPVDVASLPEAQVPDIRDVLKERPPTVGLWLRYLHVLWFFGFLFVRLLFWHKFVASFAPERVERGNLKRWRGYAREFRKFAVRTGGVMIKAGQFISTRSDILPQEITDELASLRDEVPGVPINKIRATIEEDLGPIPARYARFDETALAAASIGQVHRARLHNGDRVVVKVLRPNIIGICHTDLSAMNVVAHIAMRFRFIARRADAVALIHEFGQVLLEELSYRQEARNAARFAEIFRNDLGVYVPRIYGEHSSDRVLTIEDVTSIKLDDYAAIEAAGVSRKAVAKRLLDTYLKQIFDVRFFHADPHPGNLFVYPLPDDVAADPAYQRLDNEGGRPFYLIFIDFGMTGALSQQIVDGLIGTISAVFTRDSKALIASYSNLGFLLPGADTERLEEATRMVFDQVWGLNLDQMRDVSFDSMAMMGREFSDLLYTMPFQVPQDFIYLGRTVSILSGMTTALDPTINPWSELQPFVLKLATTPNGSGKPPISPIAGALLNVPLLNNLLNGNGAQALAGLAGQFLGRSNGSSALDRLESGDLRLKVDAASGLKNQLVRMELQQRKTTRAVLAAGLLVASTVLYTNGDGVLAVIGFGATALVYLFGVAWAEPQ